MGWLSRAEKSTDGGPPAPAATVVPRGRYGPLVSVTALDAAPPELGWQLPLDGELYRVVPGPDRPDYSLLVLERPVHLYPREGLDLERVGPDQRVTDRRGRPMLRVHALLVCSRFVGEQLHPGMRDLAVHVAHVLDTSLARDEAVDLSKIAPAGTGWLSEGHTRRPDAPAPDATDAPAVDTAAQASTGDGPSTTAADVLDEAARRLHAGVEAQRGAPVRRLVASITLGTDHRLTGLSGNADGAAPVPTPDTFEALDEVLARLRGAGPGGRVASATLRVEDGVAGHEVTATH